MDAETDKDYDDYSTTCTSTAINTPVPIYYDSDESDTEDSTTRERLMAVARQIAAVHAAAQANETGQSTTQ